MWTLMLLAATVRSFAHMPLGISDRNNLQSRDGWRGRVRSYAVILPTAAAITKAVVQTCSIKSWIFLLRQLFAFAAMPITPRLLINNFEAKSQGTVFSKSRSTALLALQRNPAHQKDSTAWTTYWNLFHKEDVFSAKKNTRHQCEKILHTKCSALFHTQWGEPILTFLDLLEHVAVFCSWCFGFVILWKVN